MRFAWEEYLHSRRFKPASDTPGGLNGEHRILQYSSMRHDTDETEDGHPWHTYRSREAQGLFPPLSRRCVPGRIQIVSVNHHIHVGDDHLDSLRATASASISSTN